MSEFNKILLSFFCLINIIIAQEVYDTTLVISHLSEISSLDSQYPSISGISPNGGEIYNTSETISIIWDASDNSFTDNSISIYISYILGENYIVIDENIPNVGQINYQLETLNSQFCRIKIVANDYFGNTSTFLGQNYFTIGSDSGWIFQPPTWQEAETIVVDVFFDSSYVSGEYELDSKFPELDIINPLGNQIYVSGQSITIDWNALDNSFTDNAISIYFSDNLGSSFDAIANQILNSGNYDFNLPDINSAFARFKLIAIDSYGNETIDINDNYIQIGEIENFDYSFTFLPASYDTVLIENDYSDISILDSEWPNIEWIYPNNPGEQFDNYEVITVDWFADDRSFGNEPISIYLSTELGGYYNPIAENIPNTQSTDIQLPSADEIFARFKITAIDDFGNFSEDYADNYFTLGDPFGEYNVNPLDDIVVLDWGWGEYQMVYINHDALDFLSDGDEIHVLDMNGVITDDCLDEEFYGLVSVDSHPYIPNITTPYPLYATQGTQDCEESEYIAPGYVEGNTMYFAHYDHSENTLNYLEPEYENGNGLFGVEFVDTLSFKYYDVSEGMIYDIYETQLFTPNMIDGDAINPVQFHVNYVTGVDAIPDWEVNVFDYEYNGSITSAVYSNDGNLILSEGDVIGAFTNNQCRGTITAEATPNAMFEDVIFSLIVYGNSPLTVVSGFNEIDSRSVDMEISHSITTRDLNQFNVYREGDMIAGPISDFYYIDNNTVDGQEYCYSIFLLDDLGEEIFESINQCISVSNSTCLVPGDAIEDGTVNILDVVALVAHVLGDTLLDIEQQQCTDVTQDGILNVLDIVMLVDMILNS